MITSRIIVNPQSKGSLGKSSFFEPLAYWYFKNSVKWSGSDLDDRHLTFSSRHPDQVKSFALGNAAESTETLLKMFQRILKQKPDVHLIDTRAQADQLLLDALESLNFYEAAESEGIRITFLLFPSNDAESLQNLVQIYERAKDRVDYVIVKTPQAKGGPLFDRSSFEKSLQALKTPTIEVPFLTESTRAAMQRIEAKRGKGLSFAEAAQNDQIGLDKLIHAELLYFLGQTTQQILTHQERFLPESLAGTITYPSKPIAPAKSSKKNTLNLNEEE